MIAFDTDVLTEILLGNDVFVERSAAISDHDQAVPVVVVEEMIRGRLHTIRQAEAGKSRISNEEPRSRDRKSTRLNSSHTDISRMPSSA